MKIAILNDTHCGIQNSSDIMMKYQERFYSEVFFPYLLENNITKVLHLGDYYDNRKSINFKALNHNRRIFLEKLRKYKIHMDIIAGNHDVFWKNTNDLSSLKELLGHYMEEVRIIEKPMVVDYDGTPVALVPWINEENEEESIRFLSRCKASILGAHLEIEGFEMQAGIPCAHGMKADLFNRFDMVLSGHFHTKSQRGNIHYLGTQMEFFWSDAHDPKFFHVLDTNTRELTAVQNPISLFKKLYYDDTVEDAEARYGKDTLPDVTDMFVKLIVVNKSKPQLFVNYVDRLKTLKLHELKIAENFEEFEGGSVDDAKVLLDTTENLLYTYVDAVETSLDKRRIKAIMHELMIEAQTKEFV